MKSKILFFCPSLIAGGLERVLSVLSSPIADYYDEVIFITWYDRPIFYKIDKRVTVVCAEKQCGSVRCFRKMRWLRTYVKNVQPDVLFSFSSPFSMIALVSLLGIKTKVVVAERNDPACFRWGYVAKILRNLLFLKAHGILVQTETSRMHLWKPLLMKSVIIPNPLLIDSEYVGVAKYIDCNHIIVTASRLVPQKRIDLLISVFADFLKTHPDYKLYIFGEGAERDKLMKLISDYELTKEVLFKGTVSNLWDWYKEAEMFVIASEYEGMSNALLEAMAVGLPCISTKVSGALDVIIDGSNGLLVDINDRDTLLAAMTILADKNELRECIGKKACHIVDELDVTKVAGLWINYIDNIIGNSN